MQVYAIAKTFEYKSCNIAFVIHTWQLSLVGLYCTSDPVLFLKLTEASGLSDRRELGRRKSGVLALFTQYLGANGVRDM